jgi:hypothetical protein
VGVCCPKPDDGFAAGAAPNGDCVFVFGVDGLGGAAVSGADWPNVKVGFGLLGSVCWLKNARHSQLNAGTESGTHGDGARMKGSDEDANRRRESSISRWLCLQFCCVDATKLSIGVN